MVVYSLPKYKGACIYLIIAPNLKPYVGQTVAFRKRMTGHKSDGKLAWINDAKWKAGKRKNRVHSISFAINKHGWENMCVTILEKFLVWDQQLLDEREKHFIRFFDSFNNGYNETEGGKGNSGFTLTEETKAKISASKMGIGAKPVTSREIKDEYADGTQLVEFVSYASAREAEKKTGVANTNISACCLKKVNSAGNRFWNYTKEDDLVGEHRVDRIRDKPMPAPEQRKKPIFSESPAGKQQLHESAGAAGRDLSKATGKNFSHGNISNCCRGERTHHHGYKFYWATPELIAQFKKKQAAHVPAQKKRKMF